MDRSSTPRPGSGQAVQQVSQRTQRASPPAVIWAFLVVLVLALIALLVTLQLNWQRAKQVQSLQDESRRLSSRIEVLQSERQMAGTQLVELQAQSAALESRLRR